jgi:hypothetical protein
MPIADLNSRARIVILAAQKELRPAAGERERLEELLDARLGAEQLDSRRLSPSSSP